MLNVLTVGRNEACAVKKSWAQKEALEGTVSILDGCVLCKVTLAEYMLSRALHLVKVSSYVQSELPPSRKCSI